MRQILVLLLAVIFFGCKNTITTQTIRDSVISNYFEMIDSSGMYDTDDMNYRALNAYVQNDTASLKKLDSFIKNKKYNRSNWELWTNDIPLPQLKQLNAQEAYRFVFSVYNAAYYEAITITKKDTAYQLQYLFYQHNKDSSIFNKSKRLKKISLKKIGTLYLIKYRMLTFGDLKTIMIIVVKMVTT